MTESISGNTNERATESIVGIGYTLLVSAEQTDGAYELMRFVVPGGHGTPPHMHRNEAESFYIVDGEFDVMIGEQTVHALPGTYLHLPRDVPHCFRNTTDGMGSFLCWVVPGNLGGFFDAFKREWPADAQEPTHVNDEDIDKMVAAAAQFDIEILPPPES